MKIILTSISMLLTAILPVSANTCSDMPQITIDEVLQAQQSWGKAIVTIGASEQPQKTAKEKISELYAFDQGSVLFKPTKAAADQFRGSQKQALSYFVTGIVTEDNGFALAPYTHVRFENEDIIIDCDSAIAMGNYYFKTTEGKEIKVEYTFGYTRDAKGSLKINLHHSSLPYNKS